MARFALVAVLCATAISIGQVTGKDLEKGYEQATKAITGMCWYEYLKIKPDKTQRAESFGNCYKNLDVKSVVSRFEKVGVPRDDYQRIKQSLAPSYNKFVKKYAPVQYHKCEEYVIDPEKEFKKDYSSVLNDGSEPYPYRGWAHCILSKMEETHGKDVLNVLKEKWSTPSHPWINEIVNRENENRANHGSPPMKLNKELTTRAQKWADQLAEKCGELTVADHIQKENPEAHYEGKQMGENIAQNGVDYPEEDAALQAANAWYEEIADYPWPEYKGQGKDPIFGKIGHFTSSVWKGVQQVGYGLARRDGCDKTYIVGRYWPGGNTPGKFAENVPPPK